MKIKKTRQRKIQLINKLHMSVLLLILFTLTVCIGRVFIVSAQNTESLTVSPAFIQAELSDASQAYVAQIAVTNSFASDAVFNLEAKGLEQTGSSLVPSGILEKTIAESVVFSDKELKVPAKSTKLFTVTIKNNQSLPPGGHYVGVVLTQKQDASKPSSLQAGISITMFVIKRGGEIQKTNVNVGDGDQGLFWLPTKVTINYKNVGNLHTIPRATVSVTDQEKNIVAKGIANEKSTPLLPGKEVEHAVEIKQFSSLWIPTKLLLVITYRDDGSANIKELTKSFMYVPPRFLALFSGLFLACVLAGKYIRKYRLMQKLKNSLLGKLCRRCLRPLFRLCRTVPVGKPSILLLPTRRSKKSRSTKNLTFSPVVITPSAAVHQEPAPNVDSVDVKSTPLKILVDSHESSSLDEKQVIESSVKTIPKVKATKRKSKKAITTAKDKPKKKKLSKTVKSKA